MPTRWQSISTIDGSTGYVAQELSGYFSEFGLIKYRVQVEVEYLIALSEEKLPWLDLLDQEVQASLREIYTNFSEADARSIKKTESVTNHDVKAVEYFVKERLTGMGLGHIKEFVHLGLTSQDINNTAVPMGIRDAIENSILPSLDSLAQVLSGIGGGGSLVNDIHTLLDSIDEQKEVSISIPPSGKSWGATWGDNALHAAYPNVDWPKFFDKFLKKLGLERQQHTTQIEHYDLMMQQFKVFKRIAHMIQLFCERNMGSFKDTKKWKIIVQHLGMAQAYFEHFSLKIPISRLQRDLTDSTVSRNFGNPFAHLVIAMNELKRQLWATDESVIDGSVGETFDPLVALSPVDGRYRRRSTEPLSAYFSEEALTGIEEPVDTFVNAMKDAIIPWFQKIRNTILSKAHEYRHISMLALTHGQPATPTNLWIQMMVFVERMDALLVRMKDPTIVNVPQMLDLVDGLNTILIDFSRDIWAYIQLNYFNQKIKAGEVGSSAMPHKVNPIDFENAEWNLWVSNGLLQYLSKEFNNNFELPQAFWVQLLGTPLAHTLIALQSLEKWIGKLLVNEVAIKSDLDKNPMVIAEAIQTIMKSEGIDGAYEQLLALTRVPWGVSLDAIHAFIQWLDIQDDVKVKLLALTPHTYVGQYPALPDLPQV
jgi:adenylosuccinate lyase